ncbi:hypothetical protein KIW84_052713 [Lathyrus oleraceus]|uniref:Uncharacterized protein n=1 Tax=Pisum sativum TaxID=3888 RepID=A0A9D4WSV2_PEA|nr:hypothetical protein KIW84_052713 [Pisum sativum]
MSESTSSQDTNTSPEPTTIPPRAVPVSQVPVNAHTMQTRVKSGFSQPRLGPRRIEVKHTSSNSLLLTQSKYIRDLLQRTNMLEASSVTTPMATSYKLTKTGSGAVADPFLYRSVVGALQYPTLTRPDITYYVNKVCQFMAHPLEAH